VSDTPPFEAFAKIPRLKRDCTITEKIDGTNGQLYFDDAGLWVGSRNRWLQPGKATDNFGFAAWAYSKEDELFEALGPGRHYGEWWGVGIQRGYGLVERRFSLFNPSRYGATLAEAFKLPNVDVVPTLYVGEFSTPLIDVTLRRLAREGSRAAPGFMQPEGVVVFHHAARTLGKVTLDKNDGHKELAA
jgi:hypothetical protein